MTETHVRATAKFVHSATVCDEEKDSFLTKNSTSFFYPQNVMLPITDMFSTEVGGRSITFSA